MTFELNDQQKFARACVDLRLGLPIVITVSKQDEGQRLYVAAAVETMNDLGLQSVRKLCVEEQTLELVLSHQRAKTLHIPVYDGDLARLRVPAQAKIEWIKAVANPTDDLQVPYKGLFTPVRGDLTQAHRAALMLAKNAHLLPAVFMVEVDEALCVTLGHFQNISAQVICDAQNLDFTSVAQASLPLRVCELGRVHVFRQTYGIEEHYAIEVGSIERDAPVLTRLHSACFTGDLMGSLKCDCGPQLRAALAQMGDAGGGVLLYLNQEGRGIGLANKMRAYSLQDQGFDTVEANYRLGFEDDERDFRVGAHLLAHLKIPCIRLLTNNPAKVSKMQSEGVVVSERVPLRVGQCAHNENYLNVKKEKSGHLL